MSVTLATLPGRHDVRTIGLVSGAHAVSHFYQLALPPLFPILHLEEGYSFTELGVLVALFYMVSGLVQPAAGFLVDRVGPRPVLYGGIALCAVATAACSLVDSMTGFVVLAMLIGAGNGVFHPADYTVLSHNVSEGRVGRGFSFHAFGGYAGYALAPITMVTIAAVAGWRVALLVAGLIGLVYLVALAAAGHAVIQVARPQGTGAEATRPSNASLLLTPVVIGCFAFFCAAAMAQIGLQTFAPSALLALYSTPATVSNAGITIFLVAVTVGILCGGVLADRTTRHHLVAIVCLLPPAALCLLPAYLDLAAPVLWSVFALIGLVFGLLIPSRDMLVRAAAPRHASGKVFGVVYSGLDVGSALTPLAFGWLLDRGQASWVFIGAGLSFAVGVFAIALSRSGSAEQPRSGCARR